MGKMVRLLIKLYLQQTSASKNVLPDIFIVFSLYRIPLYSRYSKQYIIMYCTIKRVFKSKFQKKVKHHYLYQLSNYRTVLKQIYVL